MIVCSCLGLSKRVITKEVANGANSMAKLCSRLGAGKQCGGCQPSLRKLLGEHGKHCNNK